MKKEFAILNCVFGLLVGCAETNYSDSSKGEFAEGSIEKNSAKSDGYTASLIIENMLHLSFDENYFMKKGQNFRTNSELEKLKKERTKFNPQKKETIDHGAHITGCYLGKLADGRHVVLRTYNTGGSGIFTDIVLCSVEMKPIDSYTSPIKTRSPENGTLHVDDILLLGDRALDGIIGGFKFDDINSPDRPHLESDGNLYLKMRASISTVASLAGISNKDVETGPFQSAQDFWNVSECIYNLKTKKLKIAAMDINFDDGKKQSTSDVTKILEEIFPKHGKTMRIEKDEMGEFLRKFKFVYLKLARKNRMQ